MRERKAAWSPLSDSNQVYWLIGGTADLGRLRTTLTPKDKASH